MKENEEEWGRQWRIENSGDANKQNEEDEELKKKFCISFDDDDMECCNQRHFLIDEVASKPPNKHVNQPK